jgi:hypothetical protein
LFALAKLHQHVVADLAILGRAASAREFMTQGDGIA